jgi:hypothetical protein
MAHRTSGLNKTLVPRVNCRPTERFSAILSAKIPLNLCSRLRFLESKCTKNKLCTCESSHLEFNCGRAFIKYYSTTCLMKRAIFCYIMTVQTVVYVLCIHFQTLSICKVLFETFCICRATLISVTHEFTMH